MSPHQNDLEVVANIAEIKTRVIAIEQAVTGLPLRVHDLEIEAEKRAGFIRNSWIVFGGAFSIVLGDLVLHLLKILG